MDTTGITASATRVSRGLIASMKAKQPTVVKTVSTGYMRPGPSTIRTAFMSWAPRGEDVADPEAGRRTPPGSRCRWR